MSGIIDSMTAAMGLSGWRADAVFSLIFTAILMLSVVLIGFAIGRFDEFLIDFTAKATGRGIAGFILNRVMFVGTIHHELSHALFAVMTGAKVTKIRCITLFSKDRLGYVEFYVCGGKVKQAIQLALTSCAPVMTGLLTVPLLAIVSARVIMPVWGHILIAYCALSILCHMSMSPQDLKLYGKGAVFVFPMLFVIVMCVRYFFM